MFEMYFCWSDSQISLWWIRQIRKDCKVWVENRVQVIRKNVAPNYWMYVSTDTNPGDVTNRLLSPNACISCEMWWKGPDFLQLENIDMPCQNFFGVWGRLWRTEDRDCCLPVVQKFFGIGEVVHNSRFRSLQKLPRVTSYVWWFVENLKVNLGKDGKVSGGEISAEEMDSSLKFWI